MSEYKQLFKDVSEFLSHKGYDFLVKQVRHELSTGQLSEEKIQTLREVEPRSMGLFNDPDFKKSQPAEFVRRKDYSDEESVVLLLEAAKRAIVDGSAMISETSCLFKDMGIKNVLFTSDEEKRDGYELQMENLLSLDDCRKHVDEIDRLILNIRNKKC